MKLTELTCISDNIDLNEYLTFRNLAHKHMKHPDWLRAFTKEELEELLNNGTKIWIYYLNDEAICSMMIVKESSEELEKFNLPYQEEEIIDYGGMFVNPKYFGNKLQLQMLQVLDEYTKSLGYKYAIATIHPDNYYSYNNFLEDNFNHHCFVELKRGPRNIYLKEL